jgi:Ca2+:H+ antiporter
VALVALAATWGSHPAVVVVVIIDLFLVGAVLAAVHHAEVIAHRVGEPYGSIVLAVAVTVIEVALIVTLMISGGSEAESLARDTVFAAVMITCNGIVGISILTAALRGRVASFNAEGSATAFATVITLTTLCLVLPNFTTSTNGPEFSGSQLVFAALASISLYVLFLFVQSVRHRGLFLHGRARYRRTRVTRTSPSRPTTSTASRRPRRRRCRAWPSSSSPWSRWSGSRRPAPTRSRKG